MRVFALTRAGGDGAGAMGHPQDLLRRFVQSEPLRLCHGSGRQRIGSVVTLARAWLTLGADGHAHRRHQQDALDRAEGVLLLCVRVLCGEHCVHRHPRCRKWRTLRWRLAHRWTATAWNSSSSTAAAPMASTNGRRPRMQVSCARPWRHATDGPRSCSTRRRQARRRSHRQRRRRSPRPRTSHCLCSLRRVRSARALPCVHVRSCGWFRRWRAGRFGSVYARAAAARLVAHLREHSGVLGQ